MMRLARRWVVDYFNSHDDAAAREFCAPQYALSIGEYRLAGRDEQWLPAVRKQMELFPGLGMTVHQVVAAQDRAAVLFTQHGASGGAGGRVACWSGVAIYRADGGSELLTGCVAQEDYQTRQRQLKSGVADPVDPPHPAPWDTPLLPPDPAAEAAVRAWLSQSWPAVDGTVRCDDEHLTGVLLAFEVASADVGQLYSSGSQVVFHVRQLGRYRGGLPGVAASDRELPLNCNGILTVEQGRVVGGRVVRDRAGLRAALAQGGG
jgi:hypothetical protein